MAGTTFDAGGTGHVMMGRTGLATVVTVLTAAETGHATVAIGTGAVLGKRRLVVLILGITRAPGRGVMTARAASDGRQGGVTGDAISGRGRGRMVMLVTGTAVGPGGMATFTAGHHRQSGMTVDTGLAVDGGEIMMGVASFPLVTILAAFGADHGGMAGGAGAVLGGGGGVVLIAGATSAPGTGTVAIAAVFRGGDTAMAGRAVDRYGRIGEEVMVIGTDIDGPGGGGVAAGAGGGAGQAGVAGAAFNTGSGGHVMVSGAGLAAEMTGGAILFWIEGGVAQGTGHLPFARQGMMTVAGIPLLGPVSPVVTAHTGGITARRIAVTARAFEVRFDGHLIVMEIAGLPLVTILAIIFGNDARMADAAFDARLGRDIMMAGSRFPLMADMAVLLQSYPGMTGLAVLAVGGGLNMMAGAGVAVLPPIFSIVTAGATGYRRHRSMAGIAADILGRGGDMVGGAGIAAVAALTAVPALQGGVAGATVDGLGSGGFVVGGAQLALMAAGAIAEFADAGVALGAIAA